MQDNLRETIDVTLKPFIQDTQARSVAVCLLAAIRTVERVYTKDQLAEDTKAGVMHILTDLVLMLPSNDFWLRHGGYILPVYATAVMAWLDGPVYAQRIGKGTTNENLEAVLAAQVCHNAVIETAIAVYHKSVGVSEARKRTNELREALIKIWGA